MTRPLDRYTLEQAAEICDATAAGKPTLYEREGYIELSAKFRALAATLPKEPAVPYERHTPQSLADVLERDYFPMPDGKNLYLSEHEWRMVIDALRAAAPSGKGKG